ncbi:MAG: winged helix-turn-helix transcriptional regulator [Nitrospirae bacterium]|nr:winged helix-turn-helix transcriptional regulator [Nitrospirota bacterium]
MKKLIFTYQADICKTLGNPKRLEIIEALSNGELNVTELAERLGIRKANASQHLSVLRSKGLIIARREGLNIYYSIANPKIITACGMMREVLLEQLEKGGKLVRRFRS